MKLQKLIMLFVAVFAFVFMGYGQVEPAEAPMFGNTRGIPNNFMHNFNVVSGNAQSFQFKIENKGKKVLDIVDIKIPAKIAITVLDFHINPGETGIIIATVDPTIMDKGNFYTWFLLTTQQKESNETITKEIKFIVQGEVK